MFWPILPLIALALDFILKDPPGWPHPVRLLGCVLQRLEPRVRFLPMPQQIVGGMCVVLMAGCTWIMVTALISLPAVGWFLSLYFSYAGLALGGLLQEGGRVAALLRSGEIEQARNALAGLVSRDVTNSGENDLRRSLAETVSENLNDAFVAPFFYLLLLGPAALWVYKAVSTMDSMWGYSTKQWKNLGWAAAKTDDLLAFVPARLSALFLLLCAKGMRFSHMPTWKEIMRHAAKSESPNAGWPMAAAALLLHGGMGGPATYFGCLKLKPRIGPHDTFWDDDKIVRLLRLTRNTGICFALAGFVFCLVLNALFT